MTTKCVIAPGLYGITSPEIAAARGMSLTRQVQALCEGGVCAVQYRDKTATAEKYLQQARELKAVVQSFGIPFIINDYIAVAQALQVPIHLGQTDIETIGKDKLKELGIPYGISTHSIEQAMEAQQLGASYIGCGPIFATPTKPTYVPIGFTTVERVVKKVTIPVVAIGGLDSHYVGMLKLAGIRNAAMVRAVLESDDIAEYAQEVGRALG